MVGGAPISVAWWWRTLLREPVLLYYLQLATFITWLVVLFVTADATSRMVFSPIRLGDPYKSLIFCIAAVFVFGTGRWLFWPNSLIAWQLVYGLALFAGLYALVTLFNYRRDRKSK